MVKIFDNRRGWIKIAEAFFALLLVATVVIAVVSQINIKTTSYSSKILSVERGILKEIELNYTLRTEVINTEGIVEWGDFPAQTKEKIQTLTPSYLTCVAKICEPTDECVLDEENNVLGEGDVYVDSVLIYSNLEKYNPRLLKLFCGI
ncbi:hypothetical protein FJZ20_02840 [Candidatus Pacearchaeota archaeon]|nr:hypothetical protein [Candidatus Pacearchaeota archaeon]